MFYYYFRQCNRKYYTIVNVMSCMGVFTWYGEETFDWHRNHDAEFSRLHHYYLITVSLWKPIRSEWEESLLAALWTWIPLWPLTSGMWRHVYVSCRGRITRLPTLRSHVCMLTNNPTARESKVTLSGDVPNRVCVSLALICHRTHTHLYCFTFNKNKELLFKINRRSPPCGSTAILYSAIIIHHIPVRMLVFLAVLYVF